MGMMKALSTLLHGKDKRTMANETIDFADLLGTSSTPVEKTAAPVADTPVARETAAPVADTPVARETTAPAGKPKEPKYQCLNEHCTRPEETRGLCGPCYTYVRRKVAGYPKEEQPAIWKKLEAANKVLPAKSLTVTSEAVKMREEFFGI